MPSASLTSALASVDTVTAHLLGGLPIEPGAALQSVRADASRASPLPDGSWTTEFDLPIGRWRLWPALRRAIWIGPSSAARVPPSLLQPVELKLYDAFRHLCRAEMWPSWVAVRGPEGWSDALEPSAAAWRLADGRLLDGFGGVFEYGASGVVRADLYDSGTVHAADAIVAETLLMRASGLS